jgi:hypothetical protein
MVNRFQKIDRLSNRRLWMSRAVKGSLSAWRPGARLVAKRIREFRISRLGDRCRPDADDADRERPRRQRQLSLGTKFKTQS